MRTQAETVIGTLLQEGPGLFLALLDTQRFSFRALGTTAEDAKAALFRGLKVHAQQYQLSDDWYVDTYDDAISVDQIEVGGSYRDHEKLSGPRLPLRYRSQPGQQAGVYGENPYGKPQPKPPVSTARSRRTLPS